MIDIKRFRKDNNIPQKEITELLGIQQSYLSSIENGKRPLNEEKFKILYKHYGDIILEYKIPDIIIEKKDNTKNDEEDSSRDEGAIFELICYIKERDRIRDMEIKEKDAKIEQLVRENAIMQTQIEMTKKVDAQDIVSCVDAKHSKSG